MDRIIQELLVREGFGMLQRAYDYVRADREAFLAAEEGLQGPDYDGAIIPYRSGAQHDAADDDMDWFAHLDNVLKHPITKKIIQHGLKKAVKAGADYIKGDKKEDKKEAISDSTEKPTSQLPPGKRKILPIEQAPMAEDQEVAVVKPPRKIAKSHPDYFTINLPFHFNDNLEISNGSIPFGQIRLDSCFDPIAEAAGMPRKTHQPLGRDTWGGIYDYYRVLSCDVNLTFTYLNGYFGDEATAGSTNVPHHALVGYTLVDDSSATPANANAFVEMKHTKVNMLHPTTHNTYSTVNVPGNELSRIFCHGGSTSVHHHFTPADWDLHVTQSGVDERWTAQGASPTNNRWLIYTAMYPNNDEDIASTDTIQIAVDGFLTYTVQWREVNTTKKRTIDTAQS